MHTLKKLTFLLVGTVLFLQTALVGVVSAAGTAVVTAEGPSSLSPGDERTINFYVTPSGANIYALSVRVNLSNLAYIDASYNSSGTDFFLAMPVGSSANHIEFVASATGGFGPTAGYSGKLNLASIRVRAAAEGNATISFANIQASDGNNQPMSGDGQTKSITISAPQNPGQETDPEDSDEDTGDQSKTTNKKNTGVVPTAEDKPKKQTMDVDEFIAVSAEDSGSTPEQGFAVATTKKLPLRTIGLVSTIAALAVSVVGGSALLISRQRKLAEINRHVASYVPSQPTVPTAAVQPQAPVPDNKPPVQQSQEPTIIKPTETGGKDPEA